MRKFNHASIPPDDGIPTPSALAALTRQPGPQPFKLVSKSAQCTQAAESKLCPHICLFVLGTNDFVLSLPTRVHSQYAECKEYPPETAAATGCNCRNTAWPTSCASCARWPPTDCVSDWHLEDLLRSTRSNTRRSSYNKSCNMRHWSIGLRLAPEAMGVHPLHPSGARATRSAHSSLAALAQLQHHYGMFCKAEMLSSPGRFETHRLHTVRARRACLRYSLREDESDPWVTFSLLWVT